MELDLKPETLTAFLGDLFAQLHRHLQQAEDKDNQLTIVREAHQYLRGAHALFATAATGRRVEKARDFSMDGLRARLNAMFDEASDELDELEENIFLASATAASKPAPSAP